jgi:hypothetical protein
MCKVMQAQRQTDVDKAILVPWGYKLSAIGQSGVTGIA